MKTVEISYVEEIRDSIGKRIGDFILHNLCIVTKEEFIFGKLRPVKRVWQWHYEVTEPEKAGKRLVQEMWPQEFIFEKEIVYEYSKDSINNIYVEETIGDIINNEWVTKTLPKTRLN